MIDKNGNNLELGDTVNFSKIDTTHIYIGKIVGFNNICQYVEVLVKGTSEKKFWSAERVEKINE